MFLLIIPCLRHLFKMMNSDVHLLFRFPINVLEQSGFSSAYLRSVCDHPFKLHSSPSSNDHKLWEICGR